MTKEEKISYNFKLVEEIINELGEFGVHPDIDLAARGFSIVFRDDNGKYIDRAVLKDLELTDHEVGSSALVRIYRGMLNRIKNDKPRV